MAQPINESSVSSNDFDFIYGKKIPSIIKKEKILIQVKNKIKTSRIPKIPSFLNLGKKSFFIAGFTLVLVGTGFSINDFYQKKIDLQISKSESILQSSSADNINQQINIEKITNEKTYIRNQLDINKYGKYKDVVEALGKQEEVANYQKRNIANYNSVTNKLSADSFSINELYSNLPKTRNEKIALYVGEEYKGSKTIETLQKWNESKSSGKFVYVQSMINLNSQLTASINAIEDLKKEIIQQVQERVKNNDFDLNAASASFAQDVTKQTSEQINEINQAKIDLAELKNQSVENEDGSYTVASAEAQNIITDKDLNEATSALKNYEQQAVSQINQDKSKVEELIASIKSPTPASETTPTTTNNTTVVKTGPSFLDYYLMYSWMSAVSSNSNSNSSFNNDLNSNIKNNTVAAVKTNTYKSISVPKDNLYSMNNNNSYLIEHSPT